MAARRGLLRYPRRERAEMPKSKKIPPKKGDRGLPILQRSYGVVDMAKSICYLYFMGLASFITLSLSRDDKIIDFLRIVFRLLGGSRHFGSGRGLPFCAGNACWEYYFQNKS